MITKETPTLDTSVNIHLLDPEFAFVDGEFKYTDKATGNFIPDSVMTEYNQYYGLHGYDEDNRDEFEECGDE